MAHLRRDARAGAARRDHRLLPPQPVARAVALPALARRADGRRRRCCSRRWARRGQRAARAGAGCARPALVFGAACVAMVVSGTLATAAGPHPGSREGVRRLGNFQTAVEVHVRATAAFGILLLAAARRRSGAAARRAGCCYATRGRARGRAACRWRSARSSTATGCPGGSCWSTSTLAASVWARPSALVTRSSGLAARPPANRLGRWRTNSSGSGIRSSSGPVLVAAFRGWNDGGQGASLAAGYLARVWGARAVRRDRPGGLLRLPGDAAAGARSIDGDRRAGSTGPRRVFYHARPEGSTAT